MKRVFFAILLAVLTLLAATGIGLGIIHVTDFPYTVDIEALSIAETSGLDREEILANYNAVMDFLTPFSSAEFDLPTLNYSETGAEHFVDCRNVFNGFYAAAAVSLSALAFVFSKKKLDKKTLLFSGVFTLTIPVILGIAMATNFERAFVLFHAVFFKGETWIFDPAIDEIINILPAEFFLHCGIFIVICWLLAAAAEIVAGIFGTKIKGSSSETQINTKL